LSAVGRDGHTQPRLAENWKESADGLTWEIALRRNAFFHDGSPVDSVSVKESLERSIAGSDRILSPGLDDIASIETPNDHMVLIRLRNRSTFLLDDLNLAISKRTTAQVFGTGPYVVDSTSADEVVMKSFPKYYGGTPAIERIRLKVYPTVRTAWAAMMRGEIDFLYEVGEDTREFIQGESSVAVFPFLRGYVYAIGLNTKRNALHDDRVRRALNYAIDRAAIVDQAFKGHAIPASGPAWPEHWAYDPTVPAYSYDTGKASALLDSAGLPAARSIGGSDLPPARLRFECLLPEGFALWEHIGLLVQRSLSEIGVDMSLTTLPVTRFNGRIGSGDFDAILSEFIVGNSPSRPFTFWYSTSKQNVFGFKDPNLDRAWDGIRWAANQTEYRNAFREFQMASTDSAPAIFIALGETTRAVSKRFQVIAPAGSDILHTIADWRLAGDSPRITN
jgi:peptide/nickel transport system substrate-binding protein